MELVSYLANVTARSLCLAVIALLGVWLFRVKTAAARHAAMTVVTGGMLLLAALTATLPSIPLRVLRADRAAPAVSPAPVYWVEAAAPLPPLAVQPVAKLAPGRFSRLPHFEWPEVASAVYFAVALVLLLRLAYGYLFTRRLVRASRRKGDIYESAWISVPMTVGWLHPKILLPAVWKEWEAPKLEAVLAHERMHIRRADWAIAALAALNRCVFWFNPLAWWMERKMAFLAEQACDDAAVLATGAREPYAEALLDMAAAVRTGHGRMVWEAMAMARTVEVRKRIERILDETRQIPRGLTRARWAALLACSLPILYVASVTQLAPAQSIRAAPRADYANPSPAAEPRVALAQALPATTAPRPEPKSPVQSYAGYRLVVLYFDLQSMTPGDRVRAQNEGLNFISSQMTAADKVAIMTDAGESKVLQDFTDDRDLLSRGVRSLPASGSQNGASDVSQQSAALESLASMFEMLSPLPGKKALLYISSGALRKPVVDSSHMEAAIYMALRANVAFYPVNVRDLADGAVFQSVVTASAQPPYPYIAPIDTAPTQRVDPVYPAQAMAAGVEGDVQFRIIVGTDGRVRNAQLIGGNPLLEAAAREAVSQYLYSPFKMANGEGAECETTVTVPFRLNGAPPVQSMDAVEEMRVLTRNYHAEYGGANSAGPIGDHPPQLRSKVEPEYPFGLRTQKIQGTVILAATIGADGVPKDIHVARSADPGLNAEALAVAGRWRFLAARKDGQPVEAPATLQFIFRLQ